MLGKETKLGNEATPRIGLIDVIKIWIDCGKVYSSRIHGGKSIKTSIKVSHY